MSERERERSCVGEVPLGRGGCERALSEEVPVDRGACERALSEEVPVGRGACDRERERVGHVACVVWRPLGLLGSPRSATTSRRSIWF